MEKIISVFSDLNTAGVRYSVLRGYIPIEELDTSKDIDVFVKKEDMHRFKAIMDKHGFKNPKINACRFPHIQFFNLYKEGIIKFDVVTELCFGESLITYKEADGLFDKTVMEEYIRVFPDSIALELLLIHILLDKGEISEENQQRVVNLCLRNKKEAISEIDENLKELAIECLNEDIDSINIYITKNKSRIIDALNHLKPRSDLNRLHARTNRNVKWRYRFHRLHRRSIALIGVDGSGKSTTIKELKKTLGEGCFVQYMGFREMETKWGKEWYASGKKFKIKIIPFLGVYLEMWYRYLKYRFYNGRIVLYDRFPWEAFDNGTGKYKAIYFLLFKVLFPRPYKVIYLHCSTETSLKRKNDITNVELFKSMKLRFDSKYKNDKKIMSFNTDVMETSDIVDQICKYIMDSGLYEYTF